MIHALEQIRYEVCCLRDLADEPGPAADQILAIATRLAAVLDTFDQSRLRPAETKKAPPV